MQVWKSWAAQEGRRACSVRSCAPAACGSSSASPVPSACLSWPCAGVYKPPFPWDPKDALTLATARTASLKIAVDQMVASDRGQKGLGLQASDTVLTSTSTFVH